MTGRSTLTSSCESLDSTPLPPAHENASGDAEVAVEPRVPEASTIVLHAHLQEVGGGRLGVGLQAGAGESVWPRR